MKKLILVLAAAVCAPWPAFAQTGVVLSGSANIKAADDFATQVFQDPWDMNERTDFGWWLYSNDQPSSNVSSTAIAGGLFTANGTSGGGPNFWLLETGNPFAAQLGKIGTNYPIDANKYQMLAMRMHLANAGGSGQLIWARQTLYDSALTTGSTISALRGWGVYLVDITKLTLNTADTWSGTIKMLRYAPTGTPNEAVSFDWIRLVNIDPTLCRTIDWSGATTADIYLDDDTNAANGNLGALRMSASRTAGAAASASAGCSTSGAGFKFYAGALAAGAYRVVVVGSGVNPATATAANYSSTAWVVNDAPTLTFTSPSEEGSADDFATTVLGNPWDMNATSDVDVIYNVSGFQATPMNIETPAGVSLPSQTVLSASSLSPGFSGDPAAGDPAVGFLWDTGRGKTARIDPTKYRILTMDFGLPNKARDLSLTGGSIARIVWRIAGDGFEAVSDDIIVRSRTGASVVDKIIVDMADRNALKIEQGVTTGWVAGSSNNPGIDRFRIDPHEFTPATPFFFKRVKLAALERTNGLYTIRWQYADSHPGTVDLYYDADGGGFNGTLIRAGLDASTGATGFQWDASGVSLPQVFIYADFRDTFGGGANTNRVYAKWPVVLTQNGPPTVTVNRPLLNFGLLNAPAVRTSAQTVRVSISGAPGACWSVTNPSPSLFTVSPATGAGNGSFSVSLTAASIATGLTQAADLTVGPCTGATFSNSSTVRVVARSLTFAGTPGGTMETPAEGATVSGSIAVTGWAIDDVDLTSIAVYRDPVPGESGSRIFIGNATRVDDSRPDIASFAPDSPFQYRAGWGYLLLTNFLPNGGTGTYRLLAYAVDRDGHETLLGTRTIVGANSSSDVPFGAIDTPGQGETISGAAFPNFGWVLVRGAARAHPPFGAVTVLVDGVALGSPSGWTSRSDLSSLFPVGTFSGVNSALGAFTLNTTTLANGLHTIAWIVTANNGKADGIGSRFFTVQNATSGVTFGSNAVAAAASRVAGSDLGRRPIEVGPTDAASAVRASVGYRSASLRVPADASGLRTVAARPLDRVVVDASAGPGHSYEAYALVGSRLAPLPVGATFDARRGVLYWQPGLGFAGAHDFVIVRDGYLRTPIRVVLSAAPAATLRASASAPYRSLFTSEH